MARPDLIIELSNKLLTQFFHNAAGGLLACPKPPSLFTDLTVEEVVLLRGDDPAFNGKSRALTEIEKSLRINNIDPQANVPSDEVVTITRGNVSIRVPSLYLVVSLSLRRFKVDALDTQGTSEAFNLEKFHRLASFAPPFLFRVVQSRTTISGNNIVFHLEFVSLWETGSIITANAADIKDLRNQLADLSASLPLAALGSAFQAGGSIQSVLATTPFFTDDQTESPGLRIGIDVVPTTDVARWNTFATTSTWTLQQDELWGISASSGLLIETARNLISSAVKDSADTHFDAPRISWDGHKISISISVEKDHVELGDVDTTMEPSLGKRNNRNALNWHICMTFNENLGQAIGTLLMTVLVGAGIGGLAGGPIGALIGAFIGLIAGLGIDIAITLQGKGEVQNTLGTSLPPECGAIQGNCRDCLVPVEFYIDGIGGLSLARVSPTSDGLDLAGNLDPDLGQPAPAKLKVEHVSDWEFPWTWCKAPSTNPTKFVLIHNTGQLPLKICYAEQRLRPQDKPQALVLKIKGVKTFFDDVVWVGPGATRKLEVMAQVTNRMDYDPTASLILRVLTNGGAQDIDLNQPDAAMSSNAALNEYLGNIAGHLCDNVLGHGIPAFPNGLFSSIQYTDPLPFRSTDIVRERVDLFGSALGRGVSVTGLAAGEVIGRANVVGGVLHMTLTGMHAPSETHGSSLFSLNVAGFRADFRTSARTAIAASPVEQISGHTVKRSLYVEGPWYPLHAQIVRAVQTGPYVAVITSRELRIGRVGGGAITWRATTPVEEATAIAATENLVAVATGDELLVFDLHGELLLRQQRRVIALAAGCRAFWIADEDGVTRANAEAELTACDRIDLRGVTSIVATAEGTFALAQGSIWLLAARPRRIKLTAGNAGCSPLSWLRRCSTGQAEVRSLGSAGCLPTADCEERFVVFDSAGEVRAEYPHAPFSSSLLEWPGVAVEARPEQGLLVVHDVYETSVDATRLPETLLELVPRNGDGP